MLSIGHPSRGVTVVKFIAVVVLFCVLVFLAAAPPMIRRLEPVNGIQLSRKTGRLPYEMTSLSSRNIPYRESNTTPIHLPSGPPVLSNRTIELPMADLENFLPNAYLYPNMSVPYHSSVLTFLHNPKSGGTSMRKCILALSKAAEKPAPVLVISRSIPEVRTDRLNHVTKVNDYYMGDAAFGMCDFVDGRPCSYFTLMREPFERSVSHYYFCKGGGQSWPPCNNTLEEFTLSLCSLFFRQMTLQLFCRHVVEKDVASPWECDDQVTTIDHRRYNVQDKRAVTLEYILDNLDKIFAVIGITDDFETSLRLLEHATGDPFHGLCNEKHFNAGSYGGGDDKNGTEGDKKRVRQEAIERLRKNEEVRKCLHEDIQIYNKVLEIFEMEKRMLKTM